MTDKTQSRRGLLKNTGKAAAIAVGGVTVGSTTAAAGRDPTLEVGDVPGDYELVNSPRKMAGPMPLRVGFTIRYSIPLQSPPLDIVTGIESSKGSETTKEWTLSGSGTFTAWGRFGLGAVDDIRIRSPNTGWRRKVFGP